MSFLLGGGRSMDRIARARAGWRQSPVFHPVERCTGGSFRHFGRMSDSSSALPKEEGLFALCLLAAFADGGASDNERAELKRIGESLLPPELHPAALYQKVLLRQLDVATAAAALDSPEWKQLAYEMAVCVCEADHATSEVEKTFLRDLAASLGLAAPATAALVTEADAVADAEPGAIEPYLLPSLPPPLPAAPGAGLQAEIDSLVLRYSILNGALELLPETLATMAILPLQMKLVHSVGTLHGVSLDRKHIGEFLAAAGIGATSQVVEGFARKLVGGFAGSLGKKFLGKSVGGLAKGGVNQLTSSAFSFASTYAIGQLAHRYYANGRSWGGTDAKSTFATLKDNAQQLHARYLPQIQQQAGTLDVKSVLAMVRGR
jgi:uncharacterized membrane protein YebE (DUF533 family)